jgi:hypothetical protein
VVVLLTFMNEIARTPAALTRDPTIPVVVTVAPGALTVTRSVVRSPVTVKVCSEVVWSPTVAGVRDTVNDANFQTLPIELCGVSGIALFGPGLEPSMFVTEGNAISMTP